MPLVISNYSFHRQSTRLICYIQLFHLKFKLKEILIFLLISAATFFFSHSSHLFLVTQQATHSLNIDCMPQPASPHCHLARATPNRHRVEQVLNHNSISEYQEILINLSPLPFSFFIDVFNSFSCFFISFPLIHFCSFTSLQGFFTFYIWFDPFSCVSSNIKKTGLGIEPIKAGVQKFRDPIGSTGGLTGT